LGCRTDHITVITAQAGIHLDLAGSQSGEFPIKKAPYRKIRGFLTATAGLGL